MLLTQVHLVVAMRHTYASHPLHFQRKVFLVFVHNDFVYFSHKRFEGNYNQQTNNKKRKNQGNKKALKKKEKHWKDC